MKTYAKPTGICLVGAYNLDLYCANDGHVYQEGEGSYSGKTKAKAFQYAKADGWKIFQRKDIALCPTCAAKGDSK